ncbi:MAG: four-carbon acid sugar kinase family protein, partial [Ensifer alkalisoli]|nr:four-carbon acid sugar kinase family protein [Sinorhizobium alkalisoli]
MAILLGSIADDYTGASDLANTLTKNGLSTVQTVGIPSPALALPDVDAVVVSLKIRSVAAGEAVAAALKAERWLRDRGAAHVLYKVCSTFDSTDRGNIGPVTEALSEAAGGGTVLITPAFPETGRTVYLGHLFVNGQPLNESPLKDHPLNPMHDPNLVRVMARQSRGAVGLVDLPTVMAGPDAVMARIRAMSATGVATAIADAVAENDLETLGEVAWQTALSTGASGLGLGLARAIARSGRASPPGGTATDAIRPVGGLAAIVAGSCSAATLRQIEVAERSMPVLRLDTERLLTGSDEIAAA